MEEKTTRTVRFVLTVEVESGHPAYGDPKWVADAAWGVLTNMYGLQAVYSDVTDVSRLAAGR